MNPFYIVSILLFLASAQPLRALWRVLDDGGQAPELFGCDASMVRLAGGSDFALVGGADPGTSTSNTFVRFAVDLQTYSAQWNVVDPLPIDHSVTGGARCELANGSYVIYGGTSEFPVGLSDIISVHPDGSVEVSSSSMPRPPSVYGGRMVQLNASAALLFGGITLEDPDQFAVDGVDTNTTWLLDLDTLEWTEATWLWDCLQQETLCGDSTTLSQALSSLTTLMPTLQDSISLMTSTYRPAQTDTYYDDLKAKLTTLGGFPAQIESLRPSPTPTNDDTTCSTFCTQSSAKDLDYPQPLEGASLDSNGTHLFIFGGYSCLEDYAQIGIGSSCYNGDMFIFNPVTEDWLRITPTDDAPYAATPRSYHASHYDPERQVILVTGGGYVDATSVFYFYSTTHAFNTTTLKWVPLQVVGAPPSGWSGAIERIDSSRLLYTWSCTAQSTDNKIWVLELDRSITADDCSASGAGLVNATAGMANEFTISVSDGAGGVLTTATGLAFQVNLVRSDDLGFAFERGSVVDLGTGEYRVTYTVLVGTLYNISVRLPCDAGLCDIPGSPFVLPVYSGSADLTQTSIKSVIALKFFS